MKNILNYTLYNKWYLSADVPLSVNISHSNWINTLKKLTDLPGNEVLEVGSRVVSGANFRKSLNMQIMWGLIYMKERMLM